MKKRKLPVLKIPLSRLEIFFEVIAAAGILYHLLTMLHFWPSLPETIPTHFGISGEPDGWGSKNTLILLFALNIFLYLMMTILNRFPHTFNYVVEITEKNAWEQYYNARLMMSSMKAEIVLLFAYIQWDIFQVVQGNAAGLGQSFFWVFIAVITVSPLYFIWRSRGIG